MEFLTIQKEKGEKRPNLIVFEKECLMTCNFELKISPEFLNLMMVSHEKHINSLAGGGRKYWSS